MMTDLTHDDVRARLSTAIREAGSQKAFAARAGVSAAFLSDVIRGNRAPGERVLAAIDLRRVERFVSLRGDA
ncbi:helix-turn-helix domain-containing protein [Methylorubrum thiocyanatum]|uniref:helix-turn-helix domain-containing protein n=1 Tax=Methylorubrum thiocyanatum TaxID=47958 RepID=UPI00383A8F17